jgi:phage-related protein
MEGVIIEINNTTVRIEVDTIGGSGNNISSWSFHLIYAIKSPFYKVIFTGEPEVQYIGVNSITPKFLAYFKLNVRCDRPYGYYKVKQSLSSGSSITVNNPGDLLVYPGIRFQTTTNSNFVRLLNSTNTTSISFEEFENELIIINFQLKTISSNGTNIYARWLRDDLILVPGNNVINFQQSTSSNFTSPSALTLTNIIVSFEAPAFIKGE